MAYLGNLVGLPWQALSGLGGIMILSYLVGSIPWAYLIVRSVSGEDITEHGTGNVGAMNVRRTTGSWAWFAVAMIADALKGLVPVAAVRLLIAPAGGAELPVGMTVELAESFASFYAPGAAVIGAVLGHNYSLWLAMAKGGFARTGKGLATGAGAMLAYNWVYFLVVLITGLTTIALTRYMMAGQVAAAISLPVFAVAFRQPDWPFALLAGALVYLAHHKRFVGMLRGQEPKLYVEDGAGPRG